MKSTLLSLALLPLLLTGCVHVGAGVDVDTYNQPQAAPFSHEVCPAAKQGAATASSGSGAEPQTVQIDNSSQRLAQE